MGTDLSSLHSLLLPKIPSMALSTVMVLVNHFTANEVQQWAHTHGIHWS